MRRILIFVSLWIACVGFVPQVLASWSSFVATGSATGIGSPSCAVLSSGHVVCAELSGKATMMWNEFNGTAWGKWASLSGTISSRPSCTGDGASHVICAATATSGGLLWATFDGTSWSTPATITGALYSGPSCAEYLAGEVLCVARNATGGLAWSLYNGTSWSAFANLSTAAFSAPSCTTDNNNGVVCAIFTTSNATLVNRFAAGTWKGFLNVGGTAGGVPDCTSMNSGGKVACFAKAYTAGLYVNVFNGASWAATSWSGYAGLGGAANDNMGCTSQAAGELLCGAISATNSVFYADVYNGTSWTGFTQVGTQTWNGSPSCAPLGNGKAVCVVMSVKNQLSAVVGP